MKILHVTKSFKPFWQHGGVAKVSYEISKILSERGHDVTVYTIDGFSNTLKMEDNKLIYIDGVKTYYFKNIIRPLSKNLEIISPGAIKIIKDNVATFDIIHFHDYRTSVSAITAYYAMKYKIPFVIQAHGSLCTYFQKKEFKKIFDYIIGHNMLKRASKLIALSDTESDQYKNMNIENNKIEIVPNGIHIVDYKDLCNKGEFRKKYSIKDNEKIILYVGRLHKSKGLDLLIETMMLISKKLDNVKLIMVGPDDGYRLELENMIRGFRIDDMILFTDFVSKKEKMDIYMDADVFITPKFSGFPITFIEACSFGIPIITTDHGDKFAWLHNKVGYVVGYDKEQLCNATIKILTDDILRDVFGNEGRRLVKAKFGWNNIIEKLEKTYDDCVQ